MIIELNIGDTIQAIHDLNRVKISYWKYASECGYHGAGFTKGTKFIVREVDKKALWVRAEISGSHGSSFLKISGGELSSNFIKIK